MKDIIKPVRFSQKEIKTINKAVKILESERDPEKEPERVTFSSLTRRSSVQNATVVLLAEGVDN